MLLAGVALGSFLLFGYAFLGSTDPDRDGAARKRKPAWLAAGALVYMGAAHLAVGQAPDPVYYYDQRGSGFSGRHDLRRDAPYTVADHVADLEAIREHLGADRIVPVGHRRGATLAVQYLLSHPERVERLVALSPAPF